MTSVPESVRYRFGRFALQPAERRLLADGVAVRLGGHALDLLLILVERSGRLVTKDELLRQVWHGVIIEENTLQSHIATLRKALGRGVIATVSGQGYRFIPDVTKEEAAPRSARTRMHNLPYLLTSFIGREQEIRQVVTMLASSRLATLTGAGGCGKTRLALRVAEQLQQEFADGVWLVELAPLADPTLLAQTIANTLPIKEEGGRSPAERVVDWLENRQLLLLLDNAEHLIDACARFTDMLLRRCPRLSVLATSRESLGIPGERAFRVPVLSLPDEHADLTGTKVMACEAARLFVDRARLQSPDLAITNSDVAALSTICRRLDGIALAIELAAPWVRTISLQALSQRLDDRFSVLTNGSRVALPRHRTLRSLIDWSYDLLSAAEKTLLQRTSVFAGGWTPEAADYVCLSESEGKATLALLNALADKSLVNAETQENVTRFSMLETVRHYASDRLRESGDEDHVRSRHLDYFINLAVRLNGNVDDSERQVRLKMLDPELDNLRTAFGWCEASSARSTRGLRLAGQLYWFWRLRGYFTEGRSWVVRLTSSAPNAERGDDRARALTTAGVFANFQSDYAAAEVMFHEALEILRELGERKRIASVLGNLGLIAMDRRDYATSRKFIEEALIISREERDPVTLTVGLQNVSILALYAGDLEEAETLARESVAVAIKLGRFNEAAALLVLARVQTARGDREAAQLLLRKCVEWMEEFGNRAGVADALLLLGAVSVDAGDALTARAQLRDALQIQRELGERVNMAEALEELGAATLVIDGPLHAARHWGQAELLREQIGTPQDPSQSLRYERHVAAARAALGDDAAFQRAMAEGRASTLEETLHQVLDS